MKKLSDYQAVRKVQQEKFFRAFAEYHLPWLHELTARYKERGKFPLYPTFIESYYEDGDDKAVSLLSTLLMNWKGNVTEQIKTMREVLGEHPYEWLNNRTFVLLSTGNKQKIRLNEKYGLAYWKVAKFFSMLYDLTDGGKKSLRS